MLADKSVGDADAEIARDAVVKVDAEFFGPPQHQNPMELIATVSDSIATYPGDFAIALIAFDAMVDVVSQRGSRTVPIAGLHRLPGTTPHVETDLTADELIVRIRVPATPLGRKSLGPKTVAKALMIAKERNA